MDIAKAISLTSLPQYKLINGTSYHESTAEAVIIALENVRRTKIRVELSLGYTHGPRAGEDWNEHYDVVGYVGRSTGERKVPLLVFNKRSLGGPAILDHCIIRIRKSKGKTVLYQHPNYHTK